jgi:amino acid adenylation domain-containing protein
LVEELAPERSLANTPLFQVMLVMQPQQQNVLNQIENLAVSRVGGHGVSAKYDLTLHVHEADGTFTGELEYNTDIFAEERARQMLEQWQRVLAAAVAQPQQRISELSLLSDAERQQLLVEWNDTAAEYPSEMTLPQVFEAQVERTPETIALIFENERISYHELNSRANQLSRHLVSMGVGPEQLVGICVERSVEMVVAMFATQKAGAAYVPLDPQYPWARLHFMIEDAGVRVLLTQQQHMERFAAGNLDIVCLDTDVERIAAHEETNLSSRASAANLAHVIYTSGSTGQPKGVAIDHHSAGALVAWAISAFSSEELSGVLASTSISFDLSIFELFVPLACGGTVILAENALHLPQLPAASEVTLINTVPSAMAELVRMQAVPASVRTINFAGEPLTNALVQSIYRQYNTVERVLNLYGPSEDTTYSTWATVARSVSGQPNIGRPIANGQVYILNAQQQPVPVGVTGELYVGGEGVARGYLKRPALTAERFVPHPFSEKPGARLYRTGDLARYLPNGEIEFLGRMDHQVKIRGFRIELGEIETRLLEHPDVSEAVVVARQEEDGDQRIVAYVVGSGETAPQPESLRAHVRETLPHYMVPSAFVLLDEIPLTPNGKVDRRALPEPDREALALSQSARVVAPRTEIEQLLHSIWSGVLKMESFGVHDNFFALGGHSLLAMQVITRMRAALNLPVPLRELFMHPTLAELGHLVETSLNDESSAPPQLQRVDRTGRLPLSFAQQRLWFIDQLAPGSALYNMPLAVRLRGALQLEVLDQVLSEIVRRHEVLRTGFELVEGEPVQVIATAKPMQLVIEDLSELAADQREAAARKLMKSEAQRPFDLIRGPLLRARLLRLEEEDHIALLTLHHISSDGWSMQVLLREVGLLYGAYARGDVSPLPELEIQYADYAVWQREWLQGEELERQLGYWRKQLTGAPAVLELPMDHARPPVQTHNGATQRFELGEEVSDQVRELSRAFGMTTFMVLLAAWQVLLKGLSGTTDISVGTAVAGRTDAAVEPLIGFFVNTLVLRTDLSGDPTFAELLERVREVCVGAYGHQEVPFEKLVEELAPERSLAHAPLFQVMLVMQQQQQQQGAMQQLTGLEVSGIGGEVVSAKYDLTLHVLEARGGLSGELEYNTDIFAQERGRRMVEQWQGVLAAAVAQPQRRISELPLLSEAERQQLVEWNQTAAEYPSETLPQLFEAQVERTPDAIALIFENERINYGELNRRANQLAHYLKRRGVGAEILVGVLMERSVEMVVTLLGILKAGGAYVPLDAAYPDERLRLMVQDAEIEILLTQQKLRARAVTFGSGPLCMEDLSPQLSNESAQNPSPSPDLDTLAYVIYTSGSTGVPKGVSITHRSIANHMLWMQGAFPLSSDDRVIQRTPFSFDASVWEFYAPLLNGATLVMHQPEIHLDPTALIATINHHQVTTLQLVPSLLRMVMEVAELKSCLSLRRVFCGGEALTADVVKQFRERLAVPLYNFYGPTEATIDATVSQATDEDGHVPIGRPIANTEAYVLDEQLHHVPIGVVGQLYIAGTGLARGYLHQPQLTAEKFIPHPFSVHGGERLYVTGDRARHRADGQLEFLGRQDQQVKVRGVRIELGEIEARLLEHPDVLETAVVYQNQDGTKPRLAAYVVSADPGLTAAEMRFYLKENLPEFMMPSIFVLLERLPLTANGKADRRALQVRKLDAPALEDSFLPPRDVLEFQLAQVWEDVLGVKPIGVRDNFFELGGHSFLAVRLMARIKEATGKTLPLALLMQEGTIESLASELRQTETPVAASPLVAIRREGSAPAFFCVHPAGGNVLCYQALAQHLGPDRPFYAFQARGFENGEEPFTSIESAASHYVEAMRAIQPEGPYLIGGWSIGGLIAFEMARLLQAQQQQVALLALFDSHLDREQSEEADDATLLINSALHMGLRREDLQPLVESLRTLDKDTQLDYALDHLKRHNLLPPGSEASQIRALIRVFKANVQAARTYLPLASRGRITLFKARESLGQSNGNSAADWAPLALDGVEVREIPGDHFSMMREPHVKVLAKHLNEILQQASEVTFSAASR